MKGEMPWGGGRESWLLVSWRRERVCELVCKSVSVHEPGSSSLHASSSEKKRDEERNAEEIGLSEECSPRRAEEAGKMVQ